MGERPANCALAIQRANCNPLVQCRRASMPRCALVEKCGKCGLRGRLRTAAEAIKAERKDDYCSNSPSVDRQPNSLSAIRRVNTGLRLLGRGGFCLRLTKISQAECLRSESVVYSARPQRVTLRQSRRNAFYERRKRDQNGTKKYFIWDQMVIFVVSLRKNSIEINGRGDRI